MQTLLALPFLNVYLHAGPRPVLELHWLQYAASAELRTALLQAVELSRTHQVKGWISDDRQQGAIRPRDLAWAEQEVIAPLGALGLARFAHLEPHDAMHRLTLDAMYTRLLPTMRFEFRRFEDVALARTWAAGTTTAS